VVEELRAETSHQPRQPHLHGDGSFDIPVMMHVNQYDGLTIAVSEAQIHHAAVAKRTVLSDTCHERARPSARKVLRWDSARIAGFSPLSG